MTWGIWQFHPDLPAEGALPPIDGEPPELLEGGFATAEAAGDAIDLWYGDRFDLRVLEEPA